MILCYVHVIYYVYVYLKKKLLEPEAKKMASLVADPLLGIRGGPGSGSIGESGNQGARPQVSSNLGGICNEDIRVPDKMVGLSK